MHLYNAARGLLGTNGLVAAGIPIAVGAALAAKLRSGSQVAVTFFGDGAVNHGAFHEGINLAGAWDLPVLLVCENNLYATETPLTVATRNIDIASRGAAYGIPSEAVEGNDVEAVFDAATRAVKRARRGEGPTLIECRTYRTLGHHEGDPGTGYRTKEEVELWKSRCPVAKTKSKLLSQGSVAPELLQAIEREVESVIASAVQFAEASPWPSPADAFSGVFPESSDPSSGGLWK